MTDARSPSARQGALYTGRRTEAGAPPSDDFTYCVLEPETQDRQTKDRRREKRARTRLRDGLVNERRVLVDCLIRDRSKFGAKLQLDKERVLPAIFVLTDSSSQTRFVATLIWQDGLEAGVKLKPIDG